MRLAVAIFLFLCLGAGVISCSKKTPVVVPVVNTTKASIDTPGIIIPDTGLVYPYMDTFYGNYSELTYGAYWDGYTDQYSFNDSFSQPIAFYVFHPGHDEIVFYCADGDAPIIKDTFTTNAMNYYFGRILNSRLGVNLHAVGKDTFYVGEDMKYNWAYNLVPCSDFVAQKHFCHFYGKKRKK